MLAHLGKPAAVGVETQNTATPEAVNAYWVQSQADIAAWEAECRAVDASLNLPGLKATHEAENARYVAMERDIIEKPATGLLGVAVKLALWARTELTSTLECAGGEDNEEGQQWLASPAVAAWQDALRLAGLPERMGMERKVTAG